MLVLYYGRRVVHVWSPIQPLFCPLLGTEQLTGTCTRWTARRRRALNVQDVRWASGGIALWPLCASRWPDVSLQPGGAPCARLAIVAVAPGAATSRANGVQQQREAFRAVSLGGGSALNGPTGARWRAFLAWVGLSDGVQPRRLVRELRLGPRQAALPLPRRACRRELRDDRSVGLHARVQRPRCLHQPYVLLRQRLVGPRLQPLR